MKFQINRSQLIEGVQDVMKAVSSRTTIPILTGIKMDVHSEGMTLTGSDSDISIERLIPMEENGTVNLEVQKPGSIVLQARYFSEIVKKLPNDTVEIEVGERFETKLRSGASEFSLVGLDPEEYPRLPQIEEQNVFSIQGDLLRQIIRQTVFAVSTSETRPILTGVNIKLEDGVLSCVATDSHRLALRTARIESNTEELSFQNVVIPGKSLNELSKIVEESSELVQIVVTDNQVLFKTKNTLFFSRLLDGNYPDTSKLLPSESKTTLGLSTKDFLQAIDRASLLAREGRNNVVKLATLDNQTVEISSNSPEIGKVYENVITESMEGEELKISFNAKYMIDALKAMDCTEIKVLFTGAMRPFLITPVENETVKQLILPVRTY
ncbi:DNA polymerase III subunit beta [Fictibacillus sp. WQ 8-8]|uniref:DNA polymerase III subunit beta n=1 Tax=unclassified Fictibacillus TaxID=2644029 RepID=UPI0006A79C50|nr:MULTISPECIES: DNA polymerase III subunit beta [unclassified Fictibacillus]MCQ6265072.1 DNA polymerase III subunit beta [Fictibacillus sp. WQ 8-8]MED2972355.1 DNA polymerase III subunit beta [Fictibacillus sp. B-59209]UZJ78994.1 DNA polymerase III subunit beta [Fictibacillus sp. KU28468]SFE97957.1 DNA polymerase III, beta subunit [Bacillus sp. OV194]